jgi:hypothetical protein
MPKGREEKPKSPLSAPQDRSVEPASYDLGFTELRDTNRARCEATFHNISEWAPWEWSNAMAGECGEACNITKKMARVWPANQFKQNWNKPEDQRMADLEERLALELGDVVIYADLLASRIGRSLGDCVRESFNRKSADIGSPYRIGDTAKAPQNDPVEPSKATEGSPHDLKSSSLSLATRSQETPGQEKHDE